MGIEIRKYEKADRGAVAWLFHRFQGYLMSVDYLDIVRRPPGYGEKYLRMTLKAVAREKGNMYLAMSKGKVVGLIVALVLPPSKDPGAKPGIRGRITEVYIEKTHRRKGIGAALMDSAERYLRSKGCKRIFVGVFAPNEGAHRFYRARGYKDCDLDMIRQF